MENKYLVLVIYDIIDNSRRYYMAKLLESYLTRVQKSAFEGILTKKKYEELVKKIERRYEEEDNIRVYKITGIGTLRSFPKKESIEEDIIFL